LSRTSFAQAASSCSPLLFSTQAEWKQTCLLLVEEPLDESVMLSLRDKDHFGEQLCNNSFESWLICYVLLVCIFVLMLAPLLMLLDGNTIVGRLSLSGSVCLDNRWRRSPVFILLFIFRSPLRHSHFPLPPHAVVPYGRKGINLRRLQDNFSYPFEVTANTPFRPCYGTVQAYTREVPGGESKSTTPLRHHGGEIHDSGDWAGRRSRRRTGRR
jgi:hypothetical protein